MTMKSENEHIKDEPADSQQASTSPSSDSQADAAAKKKEPGVWSELKKRWIEYYPTHRNAVTYGFIGAIIAIAMLIIGFWPVLLIALFAFIGIAYGQYRDGDARVVTFFIRLFRKHS